MHESTPKKRLVLALFRGACTLLERDALFRGACPLWGEVPSSRERALLLGEVLSSGVTPSFRENCHTRGILSSSRRVPHSGETALFQESFPPSGGLPPLWKVPFRGGPDQELFPC